MSGPEVWEGIESGDGFAYTLLRSLLLIAGAVCMIFFAVLPLTWPQQAVMGLLMLLIAVWLTRASNSYLVTLALMVMSMFATFRYGWWRIATVIDFFKDPGNKWGPLDAFFICLLLVRGEPMPSSSSSSAICRRSGRCAARPCRCPTIPTNGPPSICSSPPTTSRSSVVTLHRPRRDEHRLARRTS